MTSATYGPQTAAWRALAGRAKALEQKSIKELFAADPERFDRCSASAEGMLLDFSRQLLDPGALDLLVTLAEQTDVPRWIELMFSGHPINNTEDRPALHVALRRPAN
jgi:glucose-6-phosphate isomerase